MGYFFEKFGKDLEAVTSRNLSDWEDMLSLCGYIEWSWYSEVELLY